MENNTKQVPSKNKKETQAFRKVPKQCMKLNRVSKSNQQQLGQATENPDSLKILNCKRRSPQVLMFARLGQVISLFLLQSLRSKIRKLDTCLKIVTSPLRIQHFILIGRKKGSTSSYCCQARLCPCPLIPFQNL